MYDALIQVDIIFNNANCSYIMMESCYSDIRKKIVEFGSFSDDHKLLLCIQQGSAIKGIGIINSQK